MTIKLIVKKLPMIFLFNTLLSVWSTLLFAGMKHDPMVMGVFVDELEIRDAVHDSDQNNALILDMQTWIGKDFLATERGIQLVELSVHLMSASHPLVVIIGVALP